MKRSASSSSPAPVATFVLALASLLGVAACGPLKGGDDANRDDSSDLSSSSLVMMFAPDGALAGSPDIYEATVTFNDSDRLDVVRAGDLPTKPGDAVRLDGLPASSEATLVMGLYKTKLNPSGKTHSCTGDAPFVLTVGEAASVAVTCTPVTTTDASGPVQVFVKVARAALTITQQDPQALLDLRDFTRPLQFAHLDAGQRRVSLTQDAAGLWVHVGGDVTYFASAADASGAKAALIPRLIAGETLELEAVSGRQLVAVAGSATLALSAAPMLFEVEGCNEFRVVLPVSLANAEGTVKVDGRLFEEEPRSEFTVVNYNVENLFDQVDDERNVNYGDYRIAPNPAGLVSNWGEPVELDGQSMSWTDVKIAGIRRALLGINPAGPEVVAFQEIESPAALDRLFAALQDLGYTAKQFTEWPAGATLPAIGQGVISKYPIISWSLVQPVVPAGTAPDVKDPLRPILKTEIEIDGYPFTLYVNHWKSKGGKESLRKAAAEALQKDIDESFKGRPRADYIILGDLNSDYNEKTILEAEHNDTGGLTGLNDVLKAQGDELAVAKAKTAGFKYNLHYELDRGMRRSAWHQGFGWSTLDNWVVGPGVYDLRGITYVDNSFQIAHAGMPRLKFLFRDDGTTNRWHQTRETDKVTRHEIGGFSDHAPQWARFRIPERQSDDVLWLVGPGRPDRSDLPVAP